MKQWIMGIGVACGLLFACHAYATGVPGHSDVDLAGHHYDDPAYTYDDTALFMGRLENALIEDLAKQGIEGSLRIELIGEQQEILQSFYYGNAKLSRTKVTNVNPNNGYFTALIEIFPYTLGKNVTVSVRGQYDDVIYIPVVKNKLLKGNIIKEEDITLLQRNRRYIKGDVITQSADIIGKMAKRNIQAGKPISSRIITEPVLVSKKHPVTILYDTPTVHLRTAGIALQDGARGELIPVKNISSGVVVHAEVLSPNEVLVPSVTSNRGSHNGNKDRF